MRFLNGAFVVVCAGAVFGLMLFGLFSLIQLIAW